MLLLLQHLDSILLSTNVCAFYMFLRLVKANFQTSQIFPESHSQNQYLCNENYQSLRDLFVSIDVH